MSSMVGTGADDGDLLALLASGGDLSSFLGDLVHLAVRQVPGAEACGLTLDRDVAAGLVTAFEEALPDRRERW